MFFYIIRRLIGAVLLLIVMSITVFLMFYATSTNPARLTCGKNCTSTGIETNARALGWHDSKGHDVPLYHQYWDFMHGLWHERVYPITLAPYYQKKIATEQAQYDKICGSPCTEANKEKLYTKLQPLQDDITQMKGQLEVCHAPCLGYSPLQFSLIWPYLKSRLPVTLSLTAGAFIMWIVAGVLLGIVAALRRGKPSDRAIVSGALVFYSFPTFFISLLLLKFVVFQWGWLDVPNYVSPKHDFGAYLSNLFLPCLTLALVYAAAYIRLTRTYMLETMSEDYLRTAKAKGLTQRRIVFKHTFRAALTPIVTISGLDLGALLAGAPITETVFNFQGIGQTAVSSAITFDLPMIVVIVLLAAAFVIVANLIVDVLYAVIDPRVRY